MSAIEFRLIAIVIALGAAVAGVWSFVSYERNLGAQTVKAADAKDLAAAHQQIQNTESATLGKINEAYHQFEIQNGNITAERDAALAKLSIRASRRAPGLPGTPSTACTGATGADLSAEDAAAFINLAADATQLQLEYDRLYDIASAFSCQPAK